MTQTISGSRVLDLLVFAVLVLVMLAGASRLAVYASAPAGAAPPPTAQPSSAPPLDRLPTQD